MQFSDEFLERWEHLINQVDITEVPLECIKKIVIKFDGRRQRTINLHTLQRQGMDFDEIEAFVTRTIDSLAETVRDIDFIVDVPSVAKIVQPETDKLLEGL